MPDPDHDEESLLDWDREHLWHPYTSMTDPTPVRLIRDASGVRLRLADGREVIDAMSSWWSAIHGYRHPVLDAAVREQLSSMAHVMFGGLTHAPAVRLGQRLVSLAPTGLDQVFFADSGSVSVEVALKTALQWQLGQGRTGRTRMLTIRGGYHGDTCGCMGVCDPDGGMHAMWRGFLPEHVFAPRPPAHGAEPAAIAEWTRQFRSLALAHRDQLAAVIVEPVLQGAGGMWVYDSACLRVMREVADELDLLLIVDEIATGFGRTGRLFASQWAEVTPDVMCVGKALTGGYLTLAAMLCTTRVARGLAGSALMHGPTYMANPLACAVALASVSLLETHGWVDQVAAIHAGLRDGLAPLRTHPRVVDVRTIGAVGVVQLSHPVDVTAATSAALAAGVWVRPFRDLVYTMPPYPTTAADLATICAGINAAVEAA